MTDVCSTFELAVPARLSGTSSVVDEGRCRLAKRSSADAVLEIEICRRRAGDVAPDVDHGRSMSVIRRMYQRSGPGGVQNPKMVKFCAQKCLDSEF